MADDIIHITAGVGGEMEMVRRIEAVFQKANIQSKIICIKPNYNYESIKLKTFFDEEWVTFSKLKKLKKLTQDTEIIFYHYISNFSAIVILFYLKFLCRKKIVGIFHSNLDGPGSLIKRFLYLVRKWIVFHFALWIARHIVFVSNSQKESFQRISLYRKTIKKKVKVFYNFIPDEIILKKTSKLFDSLRLIFVGRFSFFKGFEDYLKISREIMIEHPYINFYAVGQGKCDKEKLFPQKNFYSIGQIPPHAIYSYYDQCNILFFPSYTESFGLVVLEAMARGLVILASDIPALREIVIEGKNGFFFLPGDTAKMKEIINYCLSNPNIMKKISKNNIKYIEKFSEKKNGKRYVELYLSLKKEA